MNLSLMNRVSGTVLVNSVARPMAPSRCPFLRAAQSLTSPALPLLVQQFKNICPFLKQNIQMQSSVASAPAFEQTFDQPDQPAYKPRAPEKPTACPVAAPKPVVAAPAQAAAPVYLDPEQVISEKLARLKKEGNYRVFFDIERKAGSYPKALRHSPGAMSEEVITLCSNDYLAMGQNPVKKTVSTSNTGSRD
jgi:hypothetical protein